MSRSETVTVRLSPRTRYLAELAARRQRRSLSSLVEWAVNGMVDETLGDLADLWDVDPEVRFLKLAQRHPELLTFEEECRWKQHPNNPQRSAA